MDDIIFSVFIIIMMLVILYDDPIKKITDSIMNIVCCVGLVLKMLRKQDLNVGTNEKPKKPRPSQK